MGPDRTAASAVLGAGTALALCAEALFFEVRLPLRS